MGYVALLWDRRIIVEAMDTEVEAADMARSVVVVEVDTLLQQVVMPVWLLPTVQQGVHLVALQGMALPDHVPRAQHRTGTHD